MDVLVNALLYWWREVGRTVVGGWEKARRDLESIYLVFGKVDGGWEGK